MCEEIYVTMFDTKDKNGKILNDKHYLAVWATEKDAQESLKMIKDGLIKHHWGKIVENEINRFTMTSPIMSITYYYERDWIIGREL